MYCSYCGQEHAANTQFCPITGQAISEPVLVCPNCKNDVQMEWKHCPYCQANLYPGEKFEDGYIQPTSLGRRKGIKKRWRMIGIVVLVLSILTIGVGYLLWYNNLLDSDLLVGFLSSRTPVTSPIPAVVQILSSKDTESLIEESETVTPTEVIEKTETVTEALTQPTGINTPALMQTSKFNVELLDVHAIANEDSTLSIDYLIIINNGLLADSLYYVDILLPNRHYDLRSIYAEIDGKVVRDIKHSDNLSVGTFGITLGLGENAIQPGERGELWIYIGKIEQVLLYPDDAIEDSFSVFFLTTYFDRSLVIGQTEASVTFHLPSGVQADDVIEHATPSGWSSNPIIGVDNKGHLTYNWKNINTNVYSPYEFGVSFPRAYITESKIITPTPEPTRGPWLACPGTYLSNIQVDDQAYIGFNPPVPNNVRSGPGTNFSIIGSLQNGEEVTVIDGPACADRWVWWVVRSNKTGLTGWTAEGDFDNYWLIPLP
jgi:hypothetical protein